MVCSDRLQQCELATEAMVSSLKDDVTQAQQELHAHTIKYQDVVTLEQVSRERIAKLEAELATAHTATHVCARFHFAFVFVVLSHSACNRDVHLFHLEHARRK